MTADIPTAGLSSGAAPSAAMPSGALSTAELVNRAAAQISTLVRDELALAKAEMVVKGKRAAVGGGLFGGAAMLALYGIGLLILLAVVALDLVWPLWLAVLAVTVAVFLIAAVAVLAGRGQFRGAAPPMPSEAVASMTADLAIVKTAVQDGRQS